MKNRRELVFESIHNKTKCIENTNGLINDGSFISSIGAISENLLIQLVKMAKKDRNRLRLVNALVFYLKKEELTSVVFSNLLTIHGDFRESILCGLAHSELSLFQLTELNKLRVEEALTRLILLYITSDMFSFNDLPYIIKPWKKRGVPTRVIEFSNSLNNRGKKEEVMQFLVPLQNIKQSPR